MQSEEEPGEGNCFSYALLCVIYKIDLDKVSIFGGKIL